MTGIDDAVDEMGRQDDKWGANRVLPYGTGSDIAPLRSVYDFAEAALGIATAEELADASKESNADLAKRFGKIAWMDILLEEVFEAGAESNPDRLREELVQVAAVALNWVKAIDTAKTGS